MHPPTPERRKRPGEGAPDNPHNSAVNKRKPAGAQGLAADARFRKRVEAFWPLGPRITAELLARLAAEHGCRPQVEKFLDAAIEHSDAIKQFGLDRWPGAAP